MVIGVSTRGAWAGGKGVQMRALKLAGLGVMGAVTVLVAGCGGGDTVGASHDGQPGGELTFATWHWLEAGRGDQLYEILSGYQDVNPKATIKKQESTRADYEKTISTEIGAGGGPDVFVIPDTYFTELADSGALEPLDGVLDESVEATLLPQNEQFVVEGERLGFATEVSPYGFFWNKKILEQAGVQPPTTPEALLAAATTIQQKTGVTGFAVRHQMNEEAVWWLDHSNWPFGFGGKGSDGEKLTINSAENVAAEEAYLAMYKSGAFAIGDDASTFRSKFTQGLIAMTIDCLTCMRTVTRSEGASITPADVGGSLLPFPKPNMTTVTVGIGVNTNSENKELAKDFLRFYFSKETQDKLLAANFPSTVGTDVAVPDELIAESPWAEVPLGNLSNGRSAVIPGFEIETPQIRTIVLIQIERMLAGQATPQQALDAAQEAAQAAVQ